MTTTTRLMTAEDLAAMPDDGFRHELARGEIVTMTKPGEEHGDIAWKIGWLLGQVVVPNRLGKLYAAETGFLIARNPDTVRGADVTFVRAGRLPPGRDRRKFISVAPDLAVEVRSPNDRPGRVEEKVEEWLVFGVRLLWEIDPARHTVTVRRPGAPADMLGENDSLDGGDVIPGFRCRVSEIFD